MCEGLQLVRGKEDCLDSGGEGLQSKEELGHTKAHS